MISTATGGTAPGPGTESLTAAAPAPPKGRGQPQPSEARMPPAASGPASSPGLPTTSREHRCFSKGEGGPRGRVGTQRKGPVLPISISSASCQQLTRQSPEATPASQRFPGVPEGHRQGELEEGLSELIPAWPPRSKTKVPWTDSSQACPDAGPKTPRTQDGRP